MATIVYPHILTDPDWFDANPLMENFLCLKNNINGLLDEDNLLLSATLDVSLVNVNDHFDTPSLLQTSSLSIKLSDNNSFAVKSGYTSVFAIDNTGEVTFNGVFATLPIGAIIPFDGTWQDDTTIPGWYQCDGNNGTVNLVDKFVRCGVTSGAAGGTNDAPLIEHTHGNSVGTQSASHTHYGSGTSSSDADPHYHCFNFLPSYNPVWGQKNHGARWGPQAGGVNTTLTTTGADASHTHTLSVSSFSGVSAAHTHSVSLANTGTASGSNMPCFYTSIFIQRVS